MAPKYSSTDIYQRIGVRPEELQAVLGDLGETTKGFVLPNPWIPTEAVPEDRERNSGRRGTRAAKKGRPVGGPDLGRPGAGSKRKRVQKHVHRR
jgi:hypothetical protein